MKLTPPCLLLFLAACSATPASPTQASPGSSEAPVERVAAPTEDVAPSACEAPEGESRASCQALAWNVSDVKATKRNHHSTFIAETLAGPFMYVFGGGNANTVTNGVERIDIHDDGSLGTWKPARPLPAARSGQTGGLLTVNGASVVVLAGGLGQGGVQDSSLYSTIGDDGLLGEWKTGSSVGHPRMHPGAFVRGDSIYVVGGFNNLDVWNDIVRATVLPDGTLSAWTPAGTLLGPRSHFSVSLVDDYVYVVGGLEKSAYTNPPALAEVARGHVGEDGTVGDFTLMPPFPVGISTHASFVRDGYLYVVGGIRMNPAVHEKRVWRAPIAADHTLGAWEETEPLPLARGHVHQIPQWGQHVYSVSGATDFSLDSTDTVAIGTFR